MKKIFLIIAAWGFMFNGCTKENASDYLKEEISDYSKDTYTVNAEVRFKYTIYKDLRGFDKTTVLYYFHGSEGNETAWYRSHKSIINEWRKSGRPSPVVVGITFGERWQLFPKIPGKNKSGYLELFVNEIMPSIEKQINVKVEKRYVMGISMGGANAAQLIFRYPELFEKGVIISPYIYPVSIFSNSKLIDEFVSREYVKKPGAKRWIINKIIGDRKLKLSVYGHIYNLKRDYFPDRESWDKADIFINMKEPPRGSRLKIYISCGYYDDYGFYPGAEKLALKAISLEYPVTWKTLNGGHMIMNDMEVAEFLIY